ncbi:MraY family glycosyltransferase [Flavivirga sp. 57AJ16]|uniref:MraY family glycosyltransferase n=1 Tax=Flavivirga sp. 57AJ16 TaxID=3025307 RepID=UPI002365E24D|nr:MraY family glycosyltransferase [Flavivirga sp. 57AJ16]MDD7886230.1 MraY family glycosyltransferase [Flavivirga sp. 57AJ16]
MKDEIMFVCFFVSMIVTYFQMPYIINYAKKFKLLDKPTFRKSHDFGIPYLGGVCIFFTVVFIMLLLSIMNVFSIPAFDFKLAFGLFLTLLVLIVLGLVDDFYGVNPLKKLTIQILLSTYLIVIFDIRIFNMNGLLGIYYLNYYVSFILSLFLMILLINSFNLIDGIDGLSASISSLSNFLIGYYFFKNGLLFNATIMLSFSGASIAFLFYNMNSKLTKKIFLGDNGSMSLGLISAYGIIQATNQPHLISDLVDENLFKNIQVIIITIVSYPLLDTLRVFVVRVMKGGSPFRADKNHIHHHLLKLHLTHKKSTLIIITYTILLFLLAFKLRFLDINTHFFVVFSISLMIYIIPFISKFYKKNEY